MKGIVEDATSREPVATATVEVVGRLHTTRTTANGEFWRLLLPGTYVINVRHLVLTRSDISSIVRKLWAVWTWPKYCIFCFVAVRRCNDCCATYTHFAEFDQYGEVLDVFLFPVHFILSIWSSWKFMHVIWLECSFLMFSVIKLLYFHSTTERMKGYACILSVVGAIVFYSFPWVTKIRLKYKILLKLQQK